jgi:amidase
MSPFAEYTEHDATGLAELVRGGEVTPLELTEAAIARAERENPRLNAIICPLYDRARALVQRRKLPAGPFSGVPFVVKDLVSDLKGVPKHAGSRFYLGYVPDHNSELMNRWLRTGVVVIGKTNTPELGQLPTTEPELYGPSRNPWDPGRTTGGSSGGTAAAVASRIVPFGTGGDGGGSIRIPAAACGLFGLKPTRGRTPYGPDQAAAWDGLAVEHVLTRSVRDSATMLDATCGWMPGDQAFLPRPARPFAEELGRDPGRLRVGFSTEPLLPATVHPDCQQAVRDTAALLEGLGHDVVEAAPRIDGRAFAMDFLILIAGNTWAEIHEAEAQLGKRARARDFEPLTWLSRQMARAFHAGDYIAAKRRLEQNTRPVHEFFTTFDVLLTPTLSAPPLPLCFMHKGGALGALERLVSRLPPSRLHRLDSVLEQASRDAFSFVPWTPVMNVTGQPSMSVPLQWNEQDLPIGSLFTAAVADDALLLRLAAQLETARPWARRRPPSP